jgi:hypothetical protein
MSRWTTVSRPREEAARVHAALSTGHVLDAVSVPVPGLMVESEEYAVGVFPPAALSYARYCRADVVVGNAGPSLLVGPPRFVLGYVLGNVAMRRRNRRRARRAAAAQWRPSPLGRTVVTTRRLWCEATTSGGRRWLEFPYDTISDLGLAADAVTLTFAHSAPLRLTGAWAPWCAAVIAHFRFGPYAPSMLPSLAR